MASKRRNMFGKNRRRLKERDAESCDSRPVGVFVKHQRYFPDLTPSDFHLFTKLKEFLGGKRFSNDEEVRETVEKWLSEVERSVFDEDIIKLVSRPKKCNEVDGDYAEKFGRNIFTFRFLTREYTLVELAPLLPLAVPAPPGLGDLRNRHYRLSSHREVGFLTTFDVSPAALFQLH
ncbi:hypothetical protein AAG570_000162 [Ranatra chinensis]|uniref:Uncharacterized protein n=1 Tax=Ranatra chinensis TaxID=642074 RepID=A0ABD0YWJ8_9HEMI